MNCEVLVKFRDKNTGEIHNIGDVIDIDEARFDEINGAFEHVDLVKKVEAKRTRKPRASKADADSADAAEKPKTSGK